MPELLHGMPRRNWRWLLLASVLFWGFLIIVIVASATTALTRIVRLWERTAERERMIHALYAAEVVHHAHDDEDERH